MKKPLILWTILLLAQSRLSAQYYTLRSVEGKKLTLHCYYVPFSKQLTITGLRDTIRLHDYLGTVHTRVLDSSFLEIVYNERGGSNLEQYYTALLAVKEGKIRTCLLVNTFSYSWLYKDDKRFEAKLALAGRHWGDYRIAVSATELVHDSDHPAGGLTAVGPLALHFDKIRMVFCADVQVLTQQMLAWNVNSGDGDQALFNPGDSVAEFGLRDTHYWFSGGEWYMSYDKTVAGEEDTVISRVLGLPEVQAKNSFIDSLTGHRHGISIMVVNYPGDEPGHPRWWVQAGYNSDIRFEPYFNFYVYVPDMTIKVLDPNSNKAIGLEAWRARVR